jgi:micrococcal nuclease
MSLLAKSLLGAALGALLLLPRPAGALNASAAEWLTVVWVDDGDTIVLADGRRVRYIGINAPEVAHPAYDRPGEAYGQRALAANKALVEGQKIRLEFDRDKKDHYGRLLAYVYLEDGRCVNSELVRGGWAYVLFKKPNIRYDRLLVQAQRSAMSAGAGIWKRWRETGEEIIGNRRSRRFHLVRCPESRKVHPKNRVSFPSHWKAYWHGYAPSKKCGP